MPLKIVRKYTEEGQGTIPVPTFLCEHCGNPIPTGGDGLCLWDDLKQRYGASDARTVSTVHKTCAWAFEQRYPQIQFNTLGLDVLLQQLVTELAIETDQAA